MQGQSHITNKLSKELPSPDSSCIDEAYQGFCNTIFAAAKLSIPCGSRNNYTLCWDAEYEHLYQVFLWALQGEATSSAAFVLLSHLDEKPKNHYSKAVNKIDFMYSSQLAWNIINNLTGKTRHTCYLYLISANSIVSQLVENGTYKTTNCESGRLVIEEVSQL